MNKQLFEKVKSLCKNKGVSEKYLKAITEKLGGSIADDSTDESAIETTANLIAEVAGETQSEATRWANKNQKKQKRNVSVDSDDDLEDDDDPDDDDDDPNPNQKKDPYKKLIAKMQKQLDSQAEEMKALKSEKEKGERKNSIQTLMTTHKIPKHLQERLAKSIADDEDAEEVIKSYKQDLITNGLVDERQEGIKAASEKQVDEAADDLLKAIEVKS